MFACAFVLLLLSPVIFVAFAIETRFSPKELAEMGISLENSHV